MREWIESISHVATGCAFIFGLFQFCSYRSDLKVQRSLDMNGKMFESSVSESWKKIALGFHDAETIKALRKNAKSDEDADRLIEDYLILKAKTNEMSWFNLNDYFSIIYQCIKHKACDADLISETVMSNGEQFYKTYFSFSCLYEKNKKNEIDIQRLENTRSFFLREDFKCPKLGY